MLKLYDEHYPSRQFGNDGHRNNFGAASTKHCPGVILLTFLVVGGLPSHNSLCVNKQSWLAIAKCGTYCYVRNMTIYIFVFTFVNSCFYSISTTEV